MKKTGSKVMATCTVCGKTMTTAGLIGHMAWKHGRQSKAPLLPSTTMPRLEEKRKAKLAEELMDWMAGAEKATPETVRRGNAILAELAQVLHRNIDITVTPPGPRKPGVKLFETKPATPEVKPEARLFIDKGRVVLRMVKRA